MSSSIIPAPRDLPAADQPGLTERTCRRLLLSQLKRIDDAQITLLVSTLHPLQRHWLLRAVAYRECQLTGFCRDHVEVQALVLLQAIADRHGLALIFDAAESALVHQQNDTDKDETGHRPHVKQEKTINSSLKIIRKKLKFH